MAAAPYPDPPKIAAVTTSGSGSLQITYVLPVNNFSYPVTDVQVTSNGGNTWSSCGTVDGVCRVGGLTNGLRYIVALRSVNSAGPSEPSVNGAGVPVVPTAEDADKLAKLPRSRVNVTARFDAASNDLGVDGSVTRVGIGTLPQLKFTRDIPNKAVVERHLTVSATSDATGATQLVPGRWAWQDARTIVYRPTGFWPGHSTITITSSLDSANLGVAGASTLVGSTTLGATYSFKTARSLVGRVDGKTDIMNVYVDGEKVKSFKISLGGPDWRTRNGVKVISTKKEPQKTYTSQALGLTAPEDQYSLDAKWNTRLTPSGEFIHSAPWATGRLGKYNGSHGCTNMFEDNAKWTTLAPEMYSSTRTPWAKPLLQGTALGACGTSRGLVGCVNPHLADCHCLALHKCQFRHQHQAHQACLQLVLQLQGRQQLPPRPIYWQDYRHEFFDPCGGRLRSKSKFG